MNHQRHLIREALVALLAGGGTLAGPRVYDHPYDPRSAFPALSVVDVTEQQQALSMPADVGRPIERVLLLEVTAEVQQVANYARTRDQLLAEVETLFAGATLTVTAAKSITPAGYAPGADSIGAPSMNVTGDRPIAIGRQRFEILYFTPQGNPATSL